MAAFSPQQLCSSSIFTRVLHHFLWSRSLGSCMPRQCRVTHFRLCATTVPLQLVHSLLGRVFRLLHRRSQGALGPPQAHRRLRGGPLLPLMAPLPSDFVEALLKGESLHFPPVLDLKGAVNLLTVVAFEGLLLLLYLLKVEKVIGVRLLPGVVLPGHPRRVPRAVRRMMQAVGRPALCSLPC